MNHPKYSQTLQTDYINMKKFLYKNFFKGMTLMLSTISVFELTRAIKSENTQTLTISASFFVIRVLFIILISMMKKNQETYTIILMLVSYLAALLNNYYGNYKIFENPFSSYYFGNGMGLTEAIIIFQTPQLSSRIIFRTLTMLFRFAIIPSEIPSFYVIQVVYFFVANYLDYNREMNDKKLFASYYHSKEQLNKFKDLVTHDIPDGIAIFTKDLKQCLFANNSFKSLLGERLVNTPYLSNNLETFIIHEAPNSERTETTSSSSSGPLTLLSSLTSFLQLEDQNNKLTLNLEHIITKSIYETKAFELVWDEEPAIVIIFHDITQQNTILELKIAANIQKDRILATVSHELRTPLNSILGMINLIKDDTKDSNTLNYLKICETSCNLLQSLVNSILDLNLIRANKIQLNLQKIEFRQLLKDITRLFEFQCQEKGITLNQKISSSAPKYLFTDQARLTQILINLVGNALKFTMKGGITLIAKEHSQGYIELVVEDTGVGIKEEDHDKLFKIFGKLEQTDTIVNKHGVGLGLTISDNLSKLLCRDDQLAGIKVKSVFNQGSRFSFLISTSLNDDQKALTKVPSKVPSLANLETLNLDTFGSFHETGYIDTKMKNYTFLPAKILNPHHKLQSVHQKPKKYILIVDDNPLNLFVAEKLVSSQQDYKVKTALSGEIAIDLLLNNNHKTEPIALILMDLQMPVMDGYVTTKALRDLMQKNKLPEVPILALTANDTQSDEKMCLKVGMLGMLSKPIRIQQLLPILNNCSK